MWSLAVTTSPAPGCARASTPGKAHSVRCNHGIPIPGGSFCRSHTVKPAVLDSRGVACQAHPRRVAKVSKQIEREIGRLMLTDKVLMDVTQSRTSKGDRRGSLCTCSGVHVTNDLQVVKVYMSVLSEDAAVKEQVLSRLSGLSGCVHVPHYVMHICSLQAARYVRRQIGERVRLRLTPEIRFVHDEAVERGERVLSLLKKIESGDSTVSTGVSSQSGNLADQSGEGFWEDSPAGTDADAAQQKSPFLEGVGDSDYDSDDESEASTFFSADMFPDANPVLDDIAAQKRQIDWEEQKTKPRYRVKGGKAVRK